MVEFQAVLIGTRQGRTGPRGLSYCPAHHKPQRARPVSTHFQVLPASRLVNSHSASSRGREGKGGRVVGEMGR